MLPLFRYSIGQPPCFLSFWQKKKRSFIGAKRACCHEEREMKGIVDWWHPRSLGGPPLTMRQSDAAPQEMRYHLLFGETQNYVKSRHA